MLKSFLTSRLKSINVALPQQKGLSLLEVAIGLVVLGFVALPIIRSYSGDMEKKAHNMTIGSMVETIAGVNQFFFSGNSRYPCPADITLTEGDLNYGIEKSCDLASILPCAPPSPWAANGGICKTDDTSNAIIIGAIPFATLKMTQKSGLDFWKNKLIYAVTYSQTKQASYLTAGGKIKVLAVDNPKNIIDSTEDGVPDLLVSEYDLFLFSTGETGIGGFTAGGHKLAACDVLSTSFEQENCDFDNIFFASEDPADKASSAFSRVSGPMFFDDMTEMQISPPLATWFQHEENPTYADKDYVITLATRVGIGTTTPDETLHVIGDIRSDITALGNGGNLKADAICNDSASCFTPEIITEALSQMNCDPDASFSLQRAVTRVANSQVECNTALIEAPPGSGTFLPIGGGNNLRVDNSKFKEKDCETYGLGGGIAAGVDASGDLICIIP